MRRIAYVSTAYDLAPAMVAELVAHAAASNESQQVTGFLLYNGRNFFQVIEGLEDRIGALMDRIEADPRHHGVVRLIDQQIERTLFPAWSMQHVELGKSFESRRDELAMALPALDMDLERVVRGFALLN